METRQFQEILTRECILSGDQCMIAGISGGPDSLCMLDLLCKSGLPFIAAHLNHHLRLEADEEENFVREFCKERKIQ
jgi:tRNA(Ile)-lysidine synthase TilS/MesJ